MTAAAIRAALASPRENTPDSASDLGKCRLQHETMSEAARCVNTPRPLTHSSDLSREQDAVNATPYAFGDNRLPERFWAKALETPSGCWLWTGPLTQGRGSIWMDGRTRRAHVVAYAAFRGAPVDGFVTQQTCADSACVRPDHLELVAPPSKAGATCREAGCDRRVKYGGKMLCQRHYEAEWRARTGPGWSHSTPALTKFEACLSPGPNNCWLWTGATDQRGYGRFSPGRTEKYLAHRWSYEYHRAEIPDGLQIDHLCRVKSCVNPWHLEPVTAAENMRRMFAYYRCENER